MKLPEHYEAWLDEEFPEPRGSVVEGMRIGAHRMYIKLMQDFAPAIEAFPKALEIVNVLREGLGKIHDTPPVTPTEKLINKCAFDALTKADEIAKKGLVE